MIKRGVPGDAVKDEITTLHNRKLVLTAGLTEPPAPAMFPEMAVQAWSAANKESVPPGARSPERGSNAAHLGPWSNWGTSE